MTWCNDPDEERGNELTTPTTITPRPNNTDIKPNQEIRSITCPSCGHNIEFQDQVLKLSVYIYVYWHVTYMLPSPLFVLLSFKKLLSFAHAPTLGF